MSGDWCGTLFIDGKYISDFILASPTRSWRSMYQELAGKIYRASLTFTDLVICREPSGFADVPP
jgi:hypothetical protein